MSTTGARPAAPGGTALVVVVVGDSRARTRALRGLLAGPGFSIAAEVWTAEDAEAAVVEHQPGAVLVDLHPADGGIEAIERIMGTRPTPVVVCGSLVEHSQAALAAGAVDVVGALDALPSSPQYATALRRHLQVASRVRVITHPRSRLRARGLSAGPDSPFPPASADPAASAVARPGSRAPPRRGPAGDPGRRRLHRAAPADRGRRVDRWPAGARDDPRRPAVGPVGAGARRAAHGRRLRRGPGRLAQRALRPPRRDGPARPSAPSRRGARRPRRGEHAAASRAAGRAANAAGGAVPRPRRRRSLRQCCRRLRTADRRRPADRHGPRRRRGPAPAARVRRPHHRPGRADQRRVGHAGRRPGSGRGGGRAAAVADRRRLLADVRRARARWRRERRGWRAWRRRVRRCP